MHRASIRKPRHKRRDVNIGGSISGRRQCHCDWCVGNMTMGGRRDGLRAEAELLDEARDQRLGRREEACSAW